MTAKDKETDEQRDARLAHNREACRAWREKKRRAAGMLSRKDAIALRRKRAEAKLTDAQVQTYLTNWRTTCTGES